MTKNAKAGRVMKYETPKELKQAVDDYFDSCVSNDEVTKPPTMSGLALALGFKSRTSLIDYNNRDDFADIIETARLMVEVSLEEALVSGMPAAGLIFNLKNNFSWKDKTEQSISHAGLSEWVEGLPDEEEEAE